MKWRERRGVFFSATLLLFWCGIIFYFSHQPGSGSGIEPPLWYIAQRKSAHVFEYFILCLLANRFLGRVFPQERPTRRFITAAAFALMYGFFDEIHQFFIFGRGARISDVAVDGIGVFLACLLLFFWHKKQAEK